jgi:hypothetical protein
MKIHAGVWIDHRNAFVVILDNEDQESFQRVESGMEKHVRFSGRSAAAEGSADDQRDRQFASHLGLYYDEVVSFVRDVDSILLFGPGEAKGELQTRMDSKGLGDKIVGVDTTDKMTETQIKAKVRQHFHQPRDPLQSTS